jgi:hypothetical protein
MLSALLAACAGNAVAQADEISPTRAVEKTEPMTLPEADPKSCPVTVPPDPAFMPPAPYDALGFKGYFWYGSERLWTSLPEEGAWYGLPNNPDGYTQKIFWWRDGYIWNEEPEPNLVVAGERLDGKSLPLNVSRATNAYAHDIGSAMLVGVDFPTLGCWKITGQYGKAELSFVVWVAP